MKQRLGIIGGSGIYQLKGVKILKEHKISTPLGPPSGPIVEMEIKGHPFFFLARHGQDHTLSPSEINYRANILALKTLGTGHLLSVSAVGSLLDDYPPGHFVFPNQFIDWTKGLRKRTFFENGLVGHVSTAYPIDKNFQRRLVKICQEMKIPHSQGGTYVCIEGPQFSSVAESNLYRSLGASIIGMTNVPEAYLAKEAGLAYATMAMVTDFDCWKEEHCHLDEILKTMKENFNKSQQIIPEVVKSINLDPPSWQPENQNSIITPEKCWTPQHRELIDILIGK